MCKTCDGLTKQRGSWELLCQKFDWTDIRWVKFWDASSTWQLKEVGYQSSLSGQTKVDESQACTWGELEERANDFALQSTNFHLFGWGPFWLMGIILKRKKNGVWWLELNRVTFCHWYWNCTSDEMGMPKGKDGKDCTSRRYWGDDVDSNWH